MESVKHYSYSYIAMQWAIVTVANDFASCTSAESVFYQSILKFKIIHYPTRDG